RAEAPEFDPVATRQRLDDLFEDRVHDPLDVALVKVRILVGDLLNEFGPDHSEPPCACRPRMAAALLCADYRRIRRGLKQESHWKGGEFCVRWVLRPALCAASGILQCSIRRGCGCRSRPASGRPTAIRQSETAPREAGPFKTAGRGLSSSSPSAR